MPKPEQRARAVRAAAGAAHDAHDLRELLDMLGLEPAEGLPPARRPAPAVPAQRRLKGQGMPLAELAAMLTDAGFDRRGA